MPLTIVIMTSGNYQVAVNILEIFIIIIIIITCDLGKPHCTDKAGLRQIRPRNVLKWQIWGFWRLFFYQWDMCNVLKWQIWGFLRHSFEREKRNGDDKIMLMSMRMMMVVVIVMIMMVMMIMITLKILYLSKKLPSQLSSVCEATLPRRRNRKKSICLARDTIWKKRKRYILGLVRARIWKKKEIQIVN